MKEIEDLGGYTSHSALVAKYLRLAADTVELRAQEYNGDGDMFEKAAKLAGKDVDDILAALVAVKAARLESHPYHLDSLVDYIAYSTFRLLKLVQKGQSAGGGKDSSKETAEKLRKAEERGIEMRKLQRGC